MLVLMRRVGETICIGREIKLTLTAIRQGRVRIAIRAPRRLSIDREEVHQSKVEDGFVKNLPASDQDQANGISTLVLSRRFGELVHIGADIIVAILGIVGTQARIGVDAPGTVSVDREEIFLRKFRDEQPLNHSPSCPQRAARQREDAPPARVIPIRVRRRRVLVRAED